MLNNSWQSHRWLPFALAALLIFPPGAGAQATGGAPQTAPFVQPTTIFDLKVIPLAGKQVVNDLQRRVMAPLVVQVRDQNDQPVEGADVFFRFPLEGPSARFSDRNNAKSFRTNADGQAAAIGWMANAREGTFLVQVTASRGTEQGTTAISMTNATRVTDQSGTRRKSWWSSPWAKIAVIAGAAGAIAAIVLVTHGSGSSSGTVVTATPGSPTIGGPQ